MAEKKLTLEKAVEQLHKALGKEMCVGEEQPRWPLGLLQLHQGIGGGIPRRRFVEISGPSDAGKTTLCLEIIRDVVAVEEETLQKPGGRRILYQDHESALDLEYAQRVTGKTWGIVTDLRLLPDLWKEHEILYFQPPTLEADAHIVHALLCADRLLLSVHDSIAAMVPRGVMEEAGCDGNVPATVARKLADWMPKWKGLVYRHEAGAIYVNQGKKKTIGHTGPAQYAPWTTRGGDAPRFFADVRLRVTAGKSAHHPQGKRSTVEVVRNKTSPERGGRYTYHIDGKGGIDRDREFLDLALEAGILQYRTRHGKKCDEDEEGAQLYDREGNAHAPDLSVYAQPELVAAVRAWLASGERKVKERDDEHFG